MNKSFLKWAGGKTQSLNFLSGNIGRVKGRFIEPFVGSGVVMLNIPAAGYILGDNNKDLINVYNNLTCGGTNFIKEVRSYLSGDFNLAECFYEFRDKFNNSISEIERAVLFIYLNRHCFNGLCRFNKSGKFNVPFGKYKTIYFPEKELIFFREKLVMCDTYCQSFEKTMSLAKQEDVIYCDPPYVPLSKTASFKDYSVGGFTEEQQILLAKLAEESSCKTLISNHDTDFTREIYKNANEIKIKKVSRFISAKASSRQPVYELLAIYNKGN